jgi:hypothetical protein
VFDEWVMPMNSLPSDAASLTSPSWSAHVVGSA